MIKTRTRGTVTQKQMLLMSPRRAMVCVRRASSSCAASPRRARVWGQENVEEPSSYAERSKSVGPGERGGVVKLFGAEPECGARRASRSHKAIPSGARVWGQESVEEP